MNLNIKFFIIFIFILLLFLPLNTKALPLCNCGSDSDCPSGQYCEDPSTIPCAVNDTWCGSPPCSPRYGMCMPCPCYTDGKGWHDTGGSCSGPSADPNNPCPPFKEQKYCDGCFWGSTRCVGTTGYKCASGETKCTPGDREYVWECDTDRCDWHTTTNCYDLDGWADGAERYCKSVDELWRHRKWLLWRCWQGACKQYDWEWRNDTFIKNCNGDDGWYDTATTQWVSSGDCTEKEQKKQNYKDYYCSDGSCVSGVTDTRWVDTGNTRNKPDGTACGTDYYDPYLNYCSGNTVRKHRILHDYYCDGGTCRDHTSWQNDQLVEDCQGDYCEGWYVCGCDGNYIKECRTCHNQGCSNGNCYDNPYSEEKKTINCDDSDGCIGTTYRDYSCSDGSCLPADYSCDSRCDTPPNLPTLIAPSHNTWINYNPTFRAKVSDPDGENVRAHFNVSGYGSNWGNWVSSGETSQWGPVNLGTTCGEYWWQAYTQDSCNFNSDPSGWWLVKIDKDNPTAGISYPTGTIDYATFTVSLDEDDTCSLKNQGDVDISINGGAWQDYATTMENFPYTGSDGSCYNFQYQVQDNAGNWSGFVEGGQVCIQLPPVCECSSSDGPCCSDNCNYDSSSIVCQTEAQTEYQCSGSACGDDYQKRTKDRYCPGNAATCTGSLGSSSGWSTVENCTTEELCYTSSPYCQYDASCVCECSSGPCCDGCNFKSSSTVCDTETEYRCSNTECGGDYQSRTRNQYCPGNAAICTGSYGSWSGWSTVEDCTDLQLCYTTSPYCRDEPACALEPAPPRPPPDLGPEPAPEPAPEPGPLPGGLVPCGRPGTPPCELCHFLVLARNVINFGLKIISSLAVLFIIIGGIIILTARGSVKQATIGRKIVYSAITGLVIALASWIIISAVIGLLAKPGVFISPWDEIPCPQ